MSSSYDMLFSKVYDEAYAEIARNTRETDPRRLNGAARAIAKYVVGLARDGKLNQEGEDNGKNSDEN